MNFNFLRDRIKNKSWEKLKSFSVLIVPTGSGTEAKSKHLTSGRAITILAVYTIIMWFAGFLLLNITPLRNVFFPPQATLSPAEQSIISELNKRMLFLTRQLEDLKTTNRQLKDAVLLGDSTLIDSLTNKMNADKKDSGFGGDIYTVVKKLFGIGIASQAQPDNKHDGFHFMMPLNGYISRGFSPKTGHMGIDIVARTGTPVYAAASGYVIFADYTVRDGYMMIINHTDGYITVYKHCSALLKKSRDVVTAGEIIALSGNTGEITTGPHLHFEIWKDGRPIDPKTVLFNY